MIHQNQTVENVASNSTPPDKKGRRGKRHTVRFDTELMNQVDFLSTYFELKKLEILRQLVKRRLQEDPKVWDTYVNTSNKKFRDNKEVKK